MAVPTALTISRGAIMWAASGGSLLFLLNGGPGVDKLKDFTSEMTRSAIHFWSSPGSSSGFFGGARNGGSGNGDPSQSGGEDVNAQLSVLSSELAKMRWENRTHRSGNGYFLGIGWIPLMTGASIAGGLMYFNGVTLQDFMYVTRKSFTVSVKDLKKGLKLVNEALQVAREELGEKIGLVNAKLDSTRISLENTIEQEVGKVALDLESVGTDVRNVSEKIDGVEGQLKVANRGIFLLCNVVAESVRNSGSSNSTRNGSSSLYQDLIEYTKNAISNVASITTGLQQDEKSKANTRSRSSSSSSSRGLRALGSSLAGDTSCSTSAKVTNLHQLVNPLDNVGVRFNSTSS